MAGIGCAEAQGIGADSGKVWCAGQRCDQQFAAAAEYGCEFKSESFDAWMDKLFDPAPHHAGHGFLVTTCVAQVRIDDSKCNGSG